MSDPLADAPARQYARLARVLALVMLGLDLAYLWALPSTGMAQRWAFALERAFAGRGGLAWPWEALVYVTLLALPWTLLMLPLDWIRGFWLEHRFGLSRERVTQWAWRWGKSQLVGGVLLAGLAVMLMGILRWNPSGWWLWTAVAWGVWSLVLTQWMPVLLLPLFYRQRPIQDGALIVRLKRLAQDCGPAIRGVYEIDVSRETSKANALLCGLGATRRVVLTDTLTRDFAPPEIEAVFAHELGHHHLRHLPKLLGVGAAMTLAGCWVAARVVPAMLRGFGIASIRSLAALPVVALALGVVGLVWTPWHHGLSRRFERAADRFALEATRSPQPFIAAMRKLQRQNLAEPAPSRWVEWFWYDHPPTPKRVAMAEQYSHGP